MVVEAGKLRIYPDIYERKTNTVENLRAELASSGVDAVDLDDATLNKMLARAAGKKQFVVSVKNIEAGKALLGGQTLAVVATGAPERVAIKRKRSK
jgi:hypothetical protein